VAFVRLFSPLVSLSAGSTKLRSAHVTMLVGYSVGIIQRGETSWSRATLPKAPIKLIRLLSHWMHGVELMQVILDICCIADPSPSKEPVVVIDTGVFPPRGVVVGNRQAGEHTIMLRIIRDVERVTVDGSGAFYTCAQAEGEWRTFFSSFQDAIVPDSVALSGRLVQERFSKKDGINSKGRLESEEQPNQSLLDPAIGRSQQRLIVVPTPGPHLTVHDRLATDPQVLARTWGSYRGWLHLLRTSKNRRR